MHAARAICLIVSILGTAAGAEDGLPALFRVTGIEFNDTLNVREKPDANSGVEASLAPDAVDIEVTGFSKDGSWARVNTGERPGWAAARYLERQDGPEWTDASVPLNCYGTEPFWSLKIVDGKATYDSPEGMQPSEEVSNRGTGFGPMLGFAFGEGFGVVRAEECSDGMSDRVNGLAIDLFRNVDGELQGLKGCCTLNP